MLGDYFPVRDAAQGHLPLEVIFIPIKVAQQGGYSWLKHPDQLEGSNTVTFINTHRNAYSHGIPTKPQAVVGGGHRTLPVSPAKSLVLH